MPYRKITYAEAVVDVESLGSGYKTADLDRLIAKYVKENVGVEDLRGYILGDTRLHRIYFYVSLKKIKSPSERLKFIDENLLLADWWHTDQLISFVSNCDFDLAFSYSSRYACSTDPYVRRWGYVMLISRLCRDENNLQKILSLMKNDDAYTVQMAEAWLLCELAVFFPERMLDYFKRDNDLDYSINSKAIQKISDSYRIEPDVKEQFKSLRKSLKERSNNNLDL